MHLVLADWMSIFPGLCLLLAAVLVVAVDLVMPSRHGRGDILSLVSLVGVIGAVFLLARRLLDGTPAVHGFGGSVVLDHLATALGVAICLATALLLVLAPIDGERRRTAFGEYYGLVLFAAGGMVMLVTANDFVMLFLCIEITSMAMYVLTGITRRNPRSTEAAIKYLITGAFATGFLLMGMAFLYGATGSLNYQGIHTALAAGSSHTLVALGVGMLMVGMAYKVGAAPFHGWVPDVYEGAPTTITAYMSVTVKAAAFGALLRVLVVALGPAAALWGPLLWAIAALTMIAGNVMALHQLSVKRMLAYSGIAHTGYAMVGLASMVGANGSFDPQAASGVVFYLIVYTFMTFGAFILLVYVGHEVPNGKQTEWQDGEHLDDLAGLAQRRPLAALAMGLFMISLAGLPPTAGFFGKLTIFYAAISHGQFGLAIIGMVGSAVSMYYYLRVIVTMYMRPSIYSDERPHAAVGAVLAFSAIITLVLGFAPGGLMQLADWSLRMLGGA